MRSFKRCFCGVTFFYGLAILAGCGSGGSESTADGLSAGTSSNSINSEGSLDDTDDISACTAACSTGGSTEATTGGGTTGSGTTGNNASPNPAGQTPPNGQISAGSDALTTAPPEPVRPIPAEPEIDSEQTAFFFSYDEAGSTASRDISLFAIAEGKRPVPELGRTYEFLNAEQFDHFAPQSADLFTVSMGLIPMASSGAPFSVAADENVFALGVNLSGPTLSREERRNVVLTVLLDVSGSMNSRYASETRTDITNLLEVAKHGLVAMDTALKPGDIVNLVTFSSNANVLLEGYQGGSGNLADTITPIETQASTNIAAGVELAYLVANRHFDSDKANRVVIVTDANVNTGELNPEVIAGPTVINGLEGIYFSGIGVGSSFNDVVLNSMTEVGKGEYSAMITPDDAQRIFTGGFTRFIKPAAREVRFRLSYPQELDQLQSFAEEISTVQSEVRTTNFAYNSDQFFLEFFTSEQLLGQQLALDSQITLEIEFRQSDGASRTVSVTHSLAEILGRGASEIQAATMVASLAELIAENIQCETVFASELYNSGAEHAIYQAYRENIENFCNQIAPYNYVHY